MSALSAHPLSFRDCWAEQLDTLSRSFPSPSRKLVGVGSGRRLSPSLALWRGVLPAFLRSRLHSKSGRQRPLGDSL